MKKLLLTLPILLAACTLTPPLKTPQVAATQTWKYGTPSTTSSTLPQQWWKAYNSEALNQLQAQAAATNTDVEASIARIKQSRASLTQATASLLPGLDANATTSQRIDDNRTTDRFTTSAGATLSYELDLFGGNRSTRNAARANLQGTQFAAQATSLSVQGDVTTSYFALLGAEERLTLTSQSLAFAEDILRLTQLRRQAGVLSDVELSQQQNTVASLRASLQAQTASAQATENALAVLLGVNPTTFTAPSEALVSLTAPQIPLQTPASVILNRPDIQAAEANLRAANANIGAARAALFPQLNLSLSSALAIDPTTPQASIGASLLQPIFRGGSLMAGVTLSRARKEELVATYRGTVLTALREVEDALSNLQSLEEQLRQQTIAAQNARTTANLAKLRFDNGAISMLELLDAQRTLLSSVNSLSQARQDHLTATATLIRALGGAFPAM